MRFSPAALSGSLLTIAIISTHSLMHERGPFISSSIMSSILSMQVFLATIGAPLLLLSVARSEQRRTEASLRHTSGRLIDAQERERQRIARDLHDNIGQRLTLIEIELDRIAAADRGWPRHEGLSHLRDQMSLISQAVWEVSHGLFPSNLEYLGLVNALTRLCAEIAEDVPLRIRCETSGVPDQLEIPAEVSLCLYRVAQEALQNVVRHSQAGQSAVRLHLVGNRLILDVVDDGVGFDEARCTVGLGFASIRERLKAVDGGVTVKSAPGTGTRVRVWVPLKDVMFGSAKVLAPPRSAMAR
jgi:signal transduction histidine kinase